MAKYKRASISFSRLPRVGTLPLLLLFCWCSLASPLAAQRAEFDFFTVTEGLSSPVVTDIVRDERGYLWMGTLDGLNRFDGYEFRTFNQGPYSETGLGQGDISQLSIDQEGQLIISYDATATSFDRFDPNTFTVERVQLTARDEVEGTPRTFATDRFGRTFIAYKNDDGIKVYEYTPDSLQLVINAPGEFDRLAPSVDLLVLDNSQFILYDDLYGLRHYSAVGRLIYHYRPTSFGQTDTSALSSPYTGSFRRLSLLAEGADGEVYLAFVNRPGLFLYDSRTTAPPRPVERLPGELYYRGAWRDQQQRLLVSAQSGRPWQLQLDHYFLLEPNKEVDTLDQLLQAGRRVSAVFGSDFRQTIYLGTANGLATYKQTKTGIQTYLAQEQAEEEFAHLIRGIAENRAGDIFFLTEKDGLYRIDAQTRLLNALPVINTVGDTLSIADGRGLVYGPDSLLYLTCSLAGQRDGGQLIRYDPVSCLANQITTAQSLESICNGPEGSIFIGTQNGELLRYEPGSESLLPQRDAQGQAFLPPTNLVHLSLSRDQEKLYIGTMRRGLVIYNLLTQTVSRLSPAQPGEPGEGPQLNDYDIFDIHEIENGQLLIATQGGLHRYDPVRREVLAHHGRVDGMSSNVICGILPTGDGNYWISTYYGLTYFKPAGDPTFLRYYRPDGLSNNEFNRFSFHRDRQGRNYFGGVNGLNVFRDEELLAKRPESQVIITKISCYGRNQTRSIETGLNQFEHLTVQRNEKAIAIQFAMPATPTASRNRFRVRLEGEEENWVELGSDRTARYSNLEGGHYRLLVQGADANGNYATNDLVLPIYVKQYLWEKGWFLTMLGLIVAASLAAVFYFRLRERYRSERLRTQLSSDIHDEVSGLLAGITMQSELLQGHTEDSHLRNRLQGVGEAGRKAMSKLSDVIWSIDSRRDTIGQLFQRMQEHADDVLLPLDIRYKFYFDDSFDRDKTISGDRRQDLYFIYKEAINNIARHSNGDRVQVIMTQHNKQYELLIEDNGTPQATNGLSDRRSFRTGQGLNNLRMRAERLHAKLDIETEKGYRIRLRGKRL